MPLGRRLLRVLDYHQLWPDFPDRSARKTRTTYVVLQPRACIATRTVWALPRSLATTGGIIVLFSLPVGTKMFQFPAFASARNMRMTALQAAGLSHSEIPGSTAICA